VPIQVGKAKIIGQQEKHIRATVPIVLLSINGNG
jgi:hypothetical protein